MATKKPTSTITWNTEDFLVSKLEELIKSHTIQSYQYIKHKGEDGDKDHIHLRIVPNKTIDTMDIQEMLMEYDPKHDKPIRCRDFQYSDEANWFLYVTHYKKYLDLKYNGGEKGEKIPYKWEDIKTPDWYDKECSWIRALSSLDHLAPCIAEALEGGQKPIDLVKRGENAYLVNNINSMVYNDKYHELCNKYDKLCKEYHQLLDAILKEGYFLSYDLQGQLCLEFEDVIPFINNA